MSTWQQLDAIRQQMFPQSVLTSGYRPGDPGYHGRDGGEAIDIGVAGDNQAGLMPIAAALAARYPNSTELIHNPNGSIKDGQVVPPSFWGAATWSEHTNHVHWAMTPAALAGDPGPGPASIAGTGTATTVGFDSIPGVSQLNSITTLLGFIANPKHWYRVALFMLGLMVGGLAIWELMKDTSIGKSVKGTVTKGAEAAALA